MSYFLYFLGRESFLSLNLLFLNFSSGHLLFVREGNVPAILYVTSILSTNFVQWRSLFLHFNWESSSVSTYFICNALSSLWPSFFRASLLFALFLDGLWLLGRLWRLLLLLLKRLLFSTISRIFLSLLLHFHMLSFKFSLLGLLDFSFFINIFLKLFLLFLLFLDLLLLLLLLFLNEFLTSLTL